MSDGEDVDFMTACLEHYGWATLAPLLLSNEESIDDELVVSEFTELAPELADCDCRGV